VADLGYYIARLRELPPGAALKKATMKLLGVAAVKLEKVKAKLSPAHISDEELLRSLEGFTSIEAVLRTIRDERPAFLVQPSVREQLTSLIRQKFPHLEKEIVEEAEKVCHHVFDLLGSGPVNLDEFVEKHGGREVCGYLPWHFDFKTGYRWNPKEFYKEIQPAYGKADIKVPWELSRFQHVAVLGQAYWTTGNEKYAKEFVREVDDWIDHNPPKFGVNWACSMDVAIRVANWILGFYFFKDSQVLTDEFLIKFLKSLLTHGRHIMANLENEGITNNHYLADLVGLICLGITFPEFKDARQWRKFALQELFKEMEKQVYEDGMDFEASTCYHRLVLEFFFYTAVLCRRNGIDLPQVFWDRLYKMFEVVLYILKPNGRLPQLGDNDSGRLFVLHPRAVLDGTYLLSYAAIFFQDSNFKLPRFGLAPEAIWLFGPEGAEKWQALPPRSEPPGSKAFPNAGVYVMRHKDDYMLISCGPNGQNGLGGHAHNDKLSFELCIGREEIIVDPGTYVYTPSPEWRNHFRSTACHNTIVVDGQEQNPVERDVLFRLSDLTRCRCLVWETGPEKDVFVGEHYGYLRLDPPVVHRRKVEFFKNERTWVITDYLYQPPELAKESAGTRASRSQQTHLLEFNLHIAPDVEVVPGFTATANESTSGVDINTLTRNGPIIMDRGWTTPGAASDADARSPALEHEADQQASLQFRLCCANRVLAEVQALGWCGVKCETGWYSQKYGNREEALVVNLKSQWPRLTHLSCNLQSNFRELVYYI
jgi:uncharacterized heparinase superfamily protein